MWFSDYWIGQWRLIEIKNYFVKRVLSKKKLAETENTAWDLDMHVHGEASNLLDK